MILFSYIISIICVVLIFLCIEQNNELKDIQHYNYSCIKRVKRLENEISKLTLKLLEFENKK